MKRESVRLYDPTAELSPLLRQRCQPPSNLEGKLVALFDIGKSRGDEFLDRLADLLVEQGIRTARYAKPTNTQVAPTAVLQQMAVEADVIVSALAD